MANATQPNPSMVFVVFRQHNNLAKEVMDDFLKALGLNPHDLGEVVKYLAKGDDDTIGNRLKAAFNTAQGFMVLLTPDEEARLRDEWVEDDDEENPPIFQPRPNVMLEAGMALGIDESRTILVRMARPKEPFTLPTDIDGRYLAVLGTAKKTNKKGLKDVLVKLERAECKLETELTESELDDYCERFAIAISNPREPWMAITRQRRQGLDYKRIPMKGKLLKSLSFKVRSDSPHWRAGFKLEEPSPPVSLEHDLALVNDKSMLFHVGRNEGNGEHIVTGYLNQTPTPEGIEPIIEGNFNASDDEWISISMDYDGKTKLRCFVNGKEYTDTDPSFENVNPELMRNVFLAAWGDKRDGESKYRDYEVLFTDIEAVPIY